ncbi:H/ACA RIBONUCLEOPROTEIN COMPLEX NON-CORE SUBUNIT NAF1-LIKE [Salix purpurea]|uniref:H/ACA RIBONUCLEOPROTEIN COMPLEX NON-CORE SUBUNIT NAF1-LIKE n=1 Tax=Salix purpurea TaxID=77065 RepID=A0A9Q0UBG3_SALPP|nr:H/ACA RIBONUCLEOPROTEIN COMPLEX NON-CORE SUBUNIT NAF1-LIKE [Salix purpurea]
MAVPLEDLQSWLTTKGKLSMDKENFNKNCFNTELKPSLSFFSEFPYEFDSLSSPSALSSPVESSMGSSTETESSDEDDFLGGLTRRLTQQLAVKPENKWVKAASPESTLGELGSWSVSSNGSPDGVSPPPMTPFGAKNDSWDLIYAAAGQVARLKMNNNEGLKYNRSTNYQRSALLGPTRTQNPGLTSVKIQPAGFYPSHCSSSFGHKTPEVNQYQQFVRKEQQALKQQCSSIWERQQVKTSWQAQQPHHHHQIQSRSTCVGDENGRFVRSPGLPQSAWPPLEVHAQNQRCNSTGTRAVLLGGSGVKRESAGTGVFLPRRYGNPPEPKKKNGGCSTVLLPARVVQALNLNFDDMDIKGLAQPRLNSNAAFPSDYDALMIRRNALVAQQKRSLRQESVLNHEIRLPQEWTY